MTDKLRIKTLMFTTGYAEQETTSHVVVRRVHRKGFRTTAGAIKRFLTDCRDVCDDLNGAKFVMECCKRALASPGHGRYCPTCGSRLGAQAPAERVDVVEFIRTMNVENCEFPQEAYEGLEARGWLLASGAPRSGDVVSICSFDYMVEGRAGGPIRRFNVAERRIKLHAIDASYL